MEISKKGGEGFSAEQRKVVGFGFRQKILNRKNWIFKKFSKSVAPIPLESHFENLKFEFGDIENPQILIFASKFKFFFDQNLDFALGRQRFHGQGQLELRREGRRRQHVLEEGS